ncbi:hypothetical protein X740_30985 [Mesorhizobium sp. LNHC221B00]|uniref:hypothetical protein n=1 Tax=Mesorhizobium sp. LNHC221B00 TaxID=1287233 RepID=UPI0003CE3167|nr:hypothetical protein [Mesorhizobium sp. LNHC221B00]ESY75532.1 hypothetical protein X740_30985 [Mesorhizobium sp. LNHC221B00]
MDDLTIDDIDVISNRIIKDIDSLSRDEANEAIRGAKHWPKLYEDLIAAAISDNEVADIDDFTKLQEENNALSADLNEFLTGRNEAADRLQEAIVGGRTDDALELLRDIVPGHQFLSPEAEKMLAGIRGQGALAL